MTQEMSNKKAAEAIKEHCYFSGLVPIAKEALDYAVQVLEQTSWVPVSERLPKPQKNGDKDFSDWVLITINLGKDNDTLTGVAYYCFSKKKWYAKGLVIGDVTAWMPRPKPYKAEIEKHKEWPHQPCVNYEDGCGGLYGCPCVYYEAKEEACETGRKE